MAFTGTSSLHPGAVSEPRATQPPDGRLNCLGSHPSSAKFLGVQSLLYKMGRTMAPTSWGSSGMMEGKCSGHYLAHGKCRSVAIPHLGLYSYQAESGFQEAHLSATMEAFPNENPSRCARKIPVLPNMPCPHPLPPNHTHIPGVNQPMGPVSHLASSPPRWWRRRRRCDLWLRGESPPHSVVSAALPCELSG